MVRTFKLLFKKLLRDVKNNLKQLVSIIFIVGISVTLFVGLNANSKSFENRVNKVFKNGNMADIWITVNQYNNEDYKQLLTLNEDLKEERTEKRLYLPTKIANYNANAIISRYYPSINTSFNDIKDDNFVNNYERGNFFAVDKNFLENYNEFHNTDLKINDTLMVSFPLNNFSTLFDSLIKILINIDVDKLPYISEQEKEQLKLVIEFIKDPTNLEMIKEELLFKNIDLKFKITNIMNHPENIENGKFTTSNFLLGSKYFFTQLLTNFKEKLISIGNLNSELNQLVIIFDYIINEVELLKINDSKLDFLDSFANQYVLKTKQNIDKLTSELNNYFLNNDRLLIIQNRDNYQSSAVVYNDVLQSKQLTYVFPVIFFVVAILVVLTTIAQMILKDRIQIGTLKALGFKSKHILLYYIGLFNFITFIGILVGLIIGPILLPLILNIKYDLLYALPKLGYVFPYISSLLTIVIITLGVSLLTFLLIKSELKLTPANSMREKIPQISFKKTKTSIKFPSLMMAFRNIRVNLVKSFMVICGVMGCTGLLICGFGINDTLNYGKNNDLTKIMGSDIMVSYSIGSKNVKDDINKVKGIDEFDEYHRSYGSLIYENNKVSTEIFSVNETSLDNFLKIEKWSIEKNRCAISKSLADSLSLNINDSILFTINGINYDLIIDKIVYTFSLEAIFTYNFTTPELFKNKTNAWINCDDNIQIDKIKEEILKINNVEVVITHNEQKEIIDGYMSSIFMMTTTVIVFAILLSIVVLLNLGILNFKERKREIATLKVIGFSRNQIARSLIIESIILTIIGALLGLGLGLPMEILVLEANKTPLINWLYIVEPLTYVISILISLITAIIINIFISYRINKVSMSESLKSVE